MISFWRRANSGVESGVRDLVYEGTWCIPMALSDDDRKELAGVFAEGLELYESKREERIAKENAAKDTGANGGNGGGKDGGDSDGNRKSFAERILGL